MLKSQTTPIALMTGGNGPERFGSLRSGESVINALTSLGVPHDVYDISDLAGFDPKRYEFAFLTCLLYTSPSPRDLSTSRMPSSA